MRITLAIKTLKKPIYDMKKIKKELIYIYNTHNDLCSLTCTESERYLLQLVLMNQSRRHWVHEPRLPQHGS